MARLARLTLSGYPHQVTQRGNYGQRVFEEEADFRQYLTWVGEYALRYSIDIWAYCLMPNHVHFVCVPKADGALSVAFNALHMRYAQYFHKKKGLTGHLWKGRFLSCLLDDPSVFEEIGSSRTNPVRAGLVERAEDYPWSSARNHISDGRDLALNGISPMVPSGSEWRDFLDGDGNGQIIRRIRASLKTGRPAGDTDFIKSVEGIVGRRLQALPRGRPRKVRS